MCVPVCHDESVSLWELKIKKQISEINGGCEVWQVQYPNHAETFSTYLFGSEYIRREEIIQTLCSKEKKRTNFWTKRETKSYPKQKYIWKPEVKGIRCLLTSLCLNGNLPVKLREFLRLPLLKGFLSTGGVESCMNHKTLRLP